MKRGNEVLTPEQFRELYADKRRNKFGVSDPSRRRVGGRTYASRAEMRYAERLYAQLAYGSITLVIEQPRVVLGVIENVYVPDFFVALPRVDDMWFVDVKGPETPKFRRDMKLWARYGPARLEVVDSTTLERRHVIYPGDLRQVTLGAEVKR